MPVQVCPRCQRINPEVAAFCYFDGALLQAGNDGARAGQMARDFIFPSGRRCRTFDEFALGCQEEWVSARDLLRQGALQQFFASVGRADLSRTAQDAMGQADSDIGLSSFLEALPVSRTFQPRLDIHPRRVVLGKMLVGETRQVQIKLTNQGQGHLQGTLKVGTGEEWLSIPGQGVACPISTAREQQVTLNIDTRKLVALQNYAGKLTVITNGGVVELPVGLDLVAQPFKVSPYQGVRTPREMAERMRSQPKAAAPLLENGEVAHWFASNNWNFPVRGKPIKGIAGVQQFFEAMGLSKPPPLQLSQTEVRFRCNGSDPVRFQVTLSTSARKWVYALIESDQVWLKVLTPEVSGPQRAIIGFEVDSRSLPGVPLAEARLKIFANAGQILPVRVVVESDAKALRSGPTTFRHEEPRPGPVATPRPAGERRGRSLLAPVLAMALLFCVVRAGMAPVADSIARGHAVVAAASKLNVPLPADHPLQQRGGWLRLPWSTILVRSGGDVPGDVFGQRTLPITEFRHYFAKYFLRDVIFWTWWLGPILGVAIVWRRGGRLLDWPFGLVAGAVAGIVGSATIASGLLVLDVAPHFLWDMMTKGDGTSVLGWSLLAVVCWTVMGAVLGLTFSVVPPLRRGIVEPVQLFVVGICRFCGLRGLSELFVR